MKAYYVIKREFLENIRKKSFLISTIVAPLIMFGLYSIPWLSLFFVPNEQTTVAVLDRSGRVADEFVAALTQTLKDGRPRYVTSAFVPGDGDLDARKDALIDDITNDRLHILLEMPADLIESGRVNYIGKNVLNENTRDYFRAQLNTIVLEKRFADEGIASDRISDLTKRVRFDEKKITKSGILEQEGVVGDFILAIVFVMILYFMLLSWGIAVQRSIIEEKSSRVIEVMLSSVEPKDLFIGKIVGLGSLGFVQVAFWAVVMLSLGVTSSFEAGQFMKFVKVEPREVFFLVTYFILGFMFYASVFTIVGAVCSTEQDAQNLQAFVIIPMVISLMLMFLVVQNPTTTVSVVLSMIPVFTPLLMMARVGIADPPTWQILLSVAVLIVSTYLVILFSARVFRVGILMYGKRPSLKEIVRWTRYA